MNNRLDKNKRPYRKINIAETEFLIDEISSSSQNSNDNKDIKSIITKFVCYFNLFECYLSEKEVNVWYDFNKRYNVSEIYLNEFFEYFYKRYVIINSVNEKFINLCCNVKSIFRNELMHNLIQKKNKLKVLLSISYYFRNNLYHGHKSLNELDKYAECFNKIIVLLKNVMKYSKRIICE